MFPLKSLVSKEKFGFITWIVIMINIVIAVYIWKEGSKATDLINFGLVPISVGVPSYVVSFFDKVYPFLTYQFIHGGLFQIILNLYFLYIFGTVVESRLGHKNFFIAYIVFGIIAGVVQVLVTISSGIPVVGSSGAVAGVMGVYLVLYPKSKIQTLFTLIIFFFVKNVPAIIFIAIWFILQLIVIKFTLQVDNIIEAIYLPIGGLIAGIVFGILYRLKEKYNLQ